MSRKKVALLVAIVLVGVLVVAALGVLLVRPAPVLGSVGLTALPGRVLNQSEVVVLTATARDTNGGNQSGNAAWSWAATPSTAVRIVPTADAFRVTARGIESGTVTLTADATLGGSHMQESLTLLVEPVRLVFGSLGVAPIGEAVQLPVTAVTSPGDATVVNYSGTVHFGSTDASVVLPADLTFSPSDRGRRNASFMFGTFGLPTLTATDTEARDVSGSVEVRADHRPVAGFTVAPNPADRRIVTFTSTSSDPDGDALASTSWDFGDGVKGTGVSVVHTYAATGPYEVNLTVADSWDLTSRPFSQNHTVRPVGWFAPLPPDMAIEPGRPFLGSLDFFDLFTADAPWADAASQITVFKLYAGQQEATDDRVSQIISDLNRRGIEIGSEFGALTPPGYCGDGIEGFVGHDETLRAAARLKALGGTLRYIAMDEPFAFASLYDGPGACHWSAEQVAYGVADYIAAVRTVVPDVIVGDIEPLWAGVDLSAYETWFQAFRTVNGYELPFFHMDLDWSRTDWPAAAKHLEDAAHARGIETGIIYNGDWGDTTDAAWIGHAEQRMAIYEAQAGGRPDDVIFQSWMDKPDYVLPETSPTSFTHLIDYYFRNRTVASLVVGPPSGSGFRMASGTLTHATGVPLAGAQVALTAEPLDGPGVYGEYNLTGIVPTGPTQADVGFRVNQECDCVGSADFVLYEIRYVEGTESSNRVPDGNFSARGEGWGAWGNGTLILEPSDRGSGWMLHSITTSTQTIGVNSPLFPVTPGAHYTLTVSARIPPSARGSGYFAVMFLAAEEIRRDTIPFAPAILLLGTMTTDPAGSFGLIVSPLPSGTFLVQATYAGDEQRWPAYAAVTVVP